MASIIDWRMAEELSRKWRKENPEEAERLDNMTHGELMEFLKSKGFQFEEPKKEAKLSFKLNNLDKHLLITFRTLTAIDNNEAFSSDDFRFFGLDRYLLDRQHGIGTFFAKLVKNEYVEEVGRKRSIIPTNHFREIRVYKWTPKAAEVKMPRVDP